MTVKKFAAFDIDGTLVRWQLFHTIVDQLARQNSINLDEHARMTDLFDMWKKRTDSDSFAIYEKATLHTWYALLKNLSYDEYLKAVDIVFETHKDSVYTYTRDLIKNLKTEDYFLVAISGSHQEIVDKIAEYYQFDFAVGSIYPTEKGAFTGDETTPVTDKGAVLKQVIAQHHLTLDESIAVGDTASDAKMLALVETPIAFNPNQSLLKIAHSNKWKIVVERKNVIYELEADKNKYYLL